MEIIDYQPKEVIVSIGGNEYTVAPRTEKTERALREIETGAKGLSQYESDTAVIRILLGDKAVKEIFPLGENENLDRLYSIASQVLRAYRINYSELVADSARSEMNPVLEQLRQLSNDVKPLLELTQKMTSKPNRKK